MTAETLPTRPVATVATGLVLAALPVFLVGGLAVQIRADLGFDEAALGAAVTGSFVVGAVAAPVAGRLADRLGARWSILLGGGFAVAGAAGVGLLATSWAVLAASLAVAGLGFSFMDPGLGILVAGTVPPSRQGVAFGVKEAAVPGATLLAGLAVPLVAVTVGWRWAFLLTAAPAVALVVLLSGVRLPTGLPTSMATPRATPAATPSATPAAATSDDAAGSRRLLVMIALVAGLGSAAASGVGVFLTESATASGLDPGAAGTLLAVASVAGVVARIGAGLRADHTQGSQLRLMQGMLAVGAGAMLVGSTGTVVALVVGAVGTFAAGWAWSGLLFLSLVRLRPDAPGRATGIGLSGLAIGNAAGPLAFGLLAQSVSYSAAWLGAAASAAAAAAVLGAARRQVPATT